MYISRVVSSGILLQYFQELELEPEFKNTLHENGFKLEGKTNVKRLSRQILEMVEDIQNSFLKSSLTIMMKELSYLSWMTENHAAEKQKLQNNLMVGLLIVEQQKENNEIFFRVPMRDCHH